MHIFDPGFTDALYAEHLLEASVLYDQWTARFDDDGLPWTEAHDDGRAEAHLDALRVGGEAALAVCAEQIEDGDDGEVHMAVRLFCRAGRSDLVGHAMQAADDAETRDALASALVAEMPRAWVPGALRADRLDDPLRLHIAARLVAQRRLDDTATLLRALADGPPPLQALALRALGRPPHAVAAADLRSYLEAEDAAVRREAAVALARTGDAAAIGAVRQRARTDPAIVGALGLIGSPAEIDWLHTVLAHAPTARVAADVLGLLGSPRSVPALIDGLDGVAPRACAAALHLVTDAPLIVDTDVAVPTDPDEAFDDEDGVEDVVTVTGPSLDAEAWCAWWASHAGDYEAAGRYRLGHPAGPEGQAASLAAPTVPHRLRVGIADELAVRYRMPVAFDATWEVARQQQALSAMRTWAAAQRFVPGRWILSGHYATQSRV